MRQLMALTRHRIACVTKGAVQVVCTAERALTAAAKRTVFLTGSVATPADAISLDGMWPA